MPLFSADSPCSRATRRLAILLCSLAVLAPRFAKAQTRISDRDMIALMRNLSQDSTSFRQRFDAGVQKSAIRRTSKEKQARKLVQTFQGQTDELLKRFKKDNSGAERFRSVQDAAAQVYALLQSVDVGTRATDQWQRVRLDLHQLELAYNVTASSSVPTRVSDRDMIVLMRNLSDSAKRFKPRFDDAVQKSAIRKTTRQKQVKKQVEDLVRESDGLVKRFQKDRTGTTAFSEAVNTATQVDATVNSLNLGTRAMDSWQRVRLAVQQLASAYNMPAPFGPSSTTAVTNYVQAPFSSTSTGTAAPQLQRTAAESQSVYRETSERNMENVTDVLNGQNYLLVDNDLSMIQVVPGPGNKLTTQLITMNTSNSVISPERKTEEISSFTPPNRLDKNNAPFVAAEGVGRMFNTTGDQIVTLSPTQNESRITWDLSIVDPLKGFRFSTNPGFHYTPGDVTPATRIVMGDFTGNGFSEALVFGRLFFVGSDEDWAMAIAAAADPNKEEALKVGLGYAQRTSAKDSPLPNTIVAGDFNNDGRDEIAMLKGDGQTIEFFTVDPASLRITPAGTLKLPYPMVPSVVTLVAGRFRDCVGCRANADLAVVGEVQGHTDKISVIPIQITPQPEGSFTAKVVPAPASNPYYPFMPSRGAQFVKAQAAPLAAWPQVAPEQLIISVGNFMNFSGGRIDIGTFRRADLNSKELGQFDWESTSETGKLNIRGMQAGNFDNKCAFAVKDICDARGPNPALQIEAYGEYYSGYWRHGQQIYNVRVPNPLPPPGGRPENWLAAHGDLYNWGPNQYEGIQNYFAINILPADLQGRSVKLGAPIIARIPMQIMPDLVLGMPPMHADWIAPNVTPSQIKNLNQEGCESPSVPCLMNLTVLPSQPNRENSIAFNTSMDWTEQTKTETKQQNTVDLNWGVGIETSLGFGFGPVGGNGTQLGLFQWDTSLKYMGSKTYKDSYGESKGYTAKLDITTGYSDFVLFSQKRMNYYYYPLIGRKTCVIDADPCPANEEGPAFAIFSVPDATTAARVEGDTQWWYQPVQEPGNVLSYPPDKQQLQQIFPEGVKTFTKDPPVCNKIGTNSTIISNTWAYGINSDHAFGETHSIAEATSLAVSNKWPGAEGAKTPFASGKFSQNFSKTWGTLRNGATSTDKSRGIRVSVPPLNNGVISQCCGYAWADYIFGVDNPTRSTIQRGQDMVTSPANSPILQAENVVDGPLFVGFLADPLAGAVGKGGPLSACTANYNWWQKVYDKPDVALNHPNRLNWDRDDRKVSFNNPDRSGGKSPLLNPFYQMKGFFISATDGPTPAPNLPSATAGDKLTLTARVYNYSLVDTTGTVQVRIYGQRYCPSGSRNDPSCIIRRQNQTCSVATLCGDSFLIGQTSVPLIPGFKSRSDRMGGYSPNWTTVSVPFNNTADYSGEYLVFWVVAWMQDGRGNLVAEMPDHGLTSVPDKNIADILRVPIEEHSNNVGLYGAFHQFFIAPKTSTEATGAIARLRDASMVTSRQDTLDQAAPVRIAVQAGAGAPAKIVNVAFYDGDPAQGGRLLDYQVITQINPGMLYAYNDRFNANSCGVHTLYTEAWLPGQSPVRSSTNVAVTANLADLTQSLMTATQSASIRDSEIKKDLLTQLDVALKSFQRKQTGNGEKLIDVYMRALSNDTNKGISQEDAAPLIGRARQVLSCGQTD